MSAYKGEFSNMMRDRLEVRSRIHTDALLEKQYWNDKSEFLKGSSWSCSKRYSGKSFFYPNPVHPLSIWCCLYTVLLIHIDLTLIDWYGYFFYLRSLLGEAACVQDFLQKLVHSVCLSKAGFSFTHQKILQMW